MKKLLIILIFFCSSIFSHAATYYVSNSGNDSNDGLTEGSAWKTIAKINSTSFSPNDIILFKSGDVWSEKLYMPSSGTAGNNIVFSYYGVGAKPEIRGYGELTGWTTSGNWYEYATGVWRMSLTTQPMRLWLNGAEKLESATLTLTSGFPWNWDSNYLYVYASSNPATFFSSIIRGEERQYSVEVNAKSNFELNGLKISGGSQSVVIANGKNIIIDSCEIGYRTDGSGVYTFATTGDSVSNIIVRNCILATGDSLFYTYFRGTNVNTTEDGVDLGRGTCNSKVYNNYFESWSHVGVWINSTDANYPCNDNEVYGNYLTAPLIYYSRGLTVDHNTNGYNNKVYNNIVIGTSVRCQFNGNGLKVYNNVFSGTKSVANYTNVGNGFSIEGYATPATNMEIYNNTIADCSDAGIYITSNVNYDKAYINIHDNNLINNGKNSEGGWQTNLQFYNTLSTAYIHHNTYSTNHMYSSVSANIVKYGSTIYTVPNFNNVTPTNNDVISGNDVTIDYSYPVTTSFATQIQGKYFYYNFNQSTAKTIDLVQPMIDSDNNKYSTSITIQPFSSVILTKDVVVIEPESLPNLYKPLMYKGKYLRKNGIYFKR